jgi:UDP-MurNAc hydroxylase
MYFQILSHAGLRVSSGGTELVCDPWLVGSTYWRSWWNYPPVPAELVATVKPDFIYLTHLHWDHFQSVSLRRFSPETPVVVPYDRYDRMVRDLDHVGMKNVRELRHGEQIELAPGFTLTSYHFSPFVTDSAVVIEADGVTILNANDAKLAGGPLRQVLRRHRKIDFCLRSHSSANPRACYHFIDEAPTAKRGDDNERYLRTFCQFVAAVKPRFAIPFASNNCLLHEDVFHLNSLAQTPQMLANYFERFRGDNELDTQLQVMIPGDKWDSETGFEIQRNDWFEDRKAKLESYRERVAPTLQRQAQKEARTSVSLKTVERYFARLAPAVPRTLTRKLKGCEVLLIARAGSRRTGFAVDLYGGGRVREIDADEFQQFDKRIEFPAVVLRQALAMNMFEHAGISKRVNFYATHAAMPHLKRFVRILELAEAEIFPLRRHFRRRTLRALMPRWREGLLYARAAIDLAKGYDLPELEEKYLQTLSAGGRAQTRDDASIQQSHRTQYEGF